jgi:two-component system cell cycle sensor histidine kinase/response regulator CckA
MNFQTHNPDETQRRKLQQYIFDLEEIQERSEVLAAEHQNLKQAQDLLNAILDATSHGICLIREEKIIWSNKALSDIFGWSNEELAGKTLRKLLPDAQAYAEMQKKIDPQGNPMLVISWEADLFHQNGGRVPCLVIRRPLDSSDPSGGHIVSFTDISQRKQAEQALQKAHDELEARVAKRTLELRDINRQLNQELAERKAMEKALRESEEKYRSTLQANPDPMVVYDMQGRVIYFNPAFTEVFGWTLEERVGQRMVFVPEKAWPATRQMIDKVHHGHSFSGVETQRYAKNGNLIDVSISGATYHDKEGRIAGSIVTLRDISRQKKLEIQLQQARKLEAIGTLAGGIAHDFNNLLMGLLGNVSLMQLHTDSGSPLDTKLKKIEKFIQRGTDLTKQLLGFARGGKYEVRPTDLNDLIENTMEMFARTKKEIKVRLNLSPRLNIVQVDQGQFEQVLLNLFVNAWQAMPGGGELSVTTENIVFNERDAASYGLAPGKYSKVSVTDTGVGIDKEIQQKIFDPFFTTKEKGVGTGLGLASVYGIILNHGGIITVYSEKGQGSTFNIYLAASDNVVVDAKQPHDQVLTGTETILLVDDEAMILEVAMDMLDTLGYTIYPAESGQRALDLYARHREEIQLVILDMVMPGLSGQETFNRLKTADPALKILLSSGYTLNGDAQKLLDEGCRGFIQKPFNLMQLSVKVRNILDSISTPDAR